MSVDRDMSGYKGSQIGEGHTEILLNCVIVVRDRVQVVCNRVQVLYDRVEVGFGCSGVWVRS